MHRSRERQRHTPKTHVEGTRQRHTSKTHVKYLIHVKGREPFGGPVGRSPHLPLGEDLHRRLAVRALAVPPVRPAAPRQPLSLPLVLGDADKPPSGAVERTHVGTSVQRNAEENMGNRGQKRSRAVDNAHTLVCRCMCICACVHVHVYIRVCVCTIFYSVDERRYEVPTTHQLRGREERRGQHGRTGHAWIHTYIHASGGSRFAP